MMFNTTVTATTHPSQPHQFQPIQFKPFKSPDGEFDGKRLRKSVMRKTVDYNSSVVQMLEARIWQKNESTRPSLPPDICYASEIQPPPAYLNNPINAVVTKFVRTSTNKAKCPIFCLAWTPEGRRLVTGASSGEFTLWNGLTFNFETILQAHESSVRAMVWSHNDQWMVTGDTSGYVKYWQSNMNNVKMFQAHKDPVRGLSFSPSDQKIASGSDDGTVRIWDFFRCQEERVLRGHGADVKCIDWHPSKSLLASGSKDNQQPIKLWDPRAGTSLAKLHAHKSTVMDLKWNSNGVWLCSASRDHLLKLFDIRKFSTELQIFRGHKKEASSIAWHPQHEGLFASGGSDGSILFWHVGNDKEVGQIESAHDGIIWDMAWHPLGHLLCSGSNDHTSKFWTRNRPGDKMRDKYNLNTLPPGVVGDDCVDIDDIPVSSSYITATSIPGMGPDDKVEAEAEPKGLEIIPGLGFDSIAFDRFMKKTPYAKPIPKTFQVAWNAAGGLDEDITEDDPNNWVIVEVENLFSKPSRIEGQAVVTDFGEELPPGSVPLSQIKADAIAYFGFYIPLPRVRGNVIQDAFAFFEEEDAIAEITKDPEFARKLIREKRGLYNPSINQGMDDIKEDRTEKKFKDGQRSHFSNKGNASANNFQGPRNHFGGRTNEDGFREDKVSSHFDSGPAMNQGGFGPNSNFNQNHYMQNNFKFMPNDPNMGFSNMQGLNVGPGLLSTPNMPGSNMYMRGNSPSQRFSNQGRDSNERSRFRMDESKRGYDENHRGMNRDRFSNERSARDRNRGFIKDRGEGFDKRSRDRSRGRGGTGKGRGRSGGGNWNREEGEDERRWNDRDFEEVGGGKRGRRGKKVGGGGRMRGKSRGGGGGGRKDRSHFDADY